MEKEYNVGTWLTPSDEYIKDIKQTLVENNYANENTPIGELNPIVQQVIDEVPETWEKIDISSLQKRYVPTLNLLCELPNGDYIGSNTSGEEGLFYFDSLTGEQTKIYTTGRWRSFFVDSNGFAYATSAYGILLINDKNASLISSSGSNQMYFFESNNGNIYVGGSGVRLIKNTNVETIYNSQTWTSFFESNDGSIYAGGTSAGNILYIIDNSVEVIDVGSAYGWTIFLETSSGIYAIGGTGIVLLNGNVGNKFYTSGTYTQLIQTKDGMLYALGKGTGIVLINGTTATKIVSSLTCETIFQSSKGKTYGYSDKGILLINDTATIIFSGTNFKYFIDKPKYVIVSQSKQPDGSDFLLIDKDTDQVYLVKGGE